MNLTRQQKILITLLVVVGVIMVFVNVIGPQMTILNRQKAKLESSRNELKFAISQISQIDRLSQQLVDLKNQVGRLEKILPSSFDIAHFVKTITSVAEKNELEISRLPSEQVIGGEQYIAHRFTGLSVETDYHTLGEFFGDIANMGQIVGIRNLNIQKPGTPGSSSRPISATFDLEVYTFKG